MRLLEERPAKRRLGQNRNMRKKQEKARQRSKRTRTKIKETSNRLRLSVFRSNKHISAQIIDDGQKKTLVSANDLKLKRSRRKVGIPTQKASGEKMTKTEIAQEVGKLIAQEANKKKIKEVVFDRGKYRYHGRIKALAEGAREGGLKF